MPKWMRAVDHFAPGQVARCSGAALSGQPEEPRPDGGRRGLDRPGGSRRRRERHRRTVFVVLGSVTVAGAGAVLPRRRRPGHRAAGLVKEFMADHNAVIMMVVLLVLGAKLIGNGIAGLRD